MDALAKYTNIPKHDLLEEDLILHSLLKSISTDDVLEPRLLFKGGTCLSKCYANYHRFSEDLDFTWVAPSNWFQLGRQELARELREPRRILTSRIKRIAASVGLRTVPEAEADALFGRSGQMLTYRLAYDSTVLNVETVIRIQVSLLEPIFFKSKQRTAISLVSQNTPQELQFLAPEQTREYARPIPAQCYAPEEIVSEKGRAILIREAIKIKIRDVVDLFVLQEELGFPLARFVDSIERKTLFLAKRHERYRAQLQQAPARFEALLEQDASGIMLRDLHQSSFNQFRITTLDHLETVRQRVISALSKPLKRAD